MKSFFIALSVGGGRSRKLNDRPPRALRYRRCSSECDLLHRWGLGFRQCSFRPITRVLRDDTFSVFQCPPLFRHAPFPSGFRLQVNRMTQEQPSGLLLTESGIQHRVPRRTLSGHTAFPLSVILSLDRVMLEAQRPQVRRLVGIRLPAEDAPRTDMVHMPRSESIGTSPLRGILGGP